ncbi:type 2 periplasmic-binding domain-containing protein [Bowmanella dokdonensis]|uniref:Solute-binding protein family 3/N-terminal domain-containing protein n=1 Tax=Bowmanella dokdonensis TaxID=751969 RepID=A0A939DQW0_9ALTE|nr:hypothetical protein [Bowmanella dokdonensis]MBN7826570.1 hypothetical protein [Bowmanella dokdonensis]
MNCRLAAMQMSVIRCLLMCLLICPPLLQAEEVPVKKTFIVGVEALRFYPFFDFSPEMEDKGLLIRILDDFAASRGIQFEYVSVPIKRFQNWLDDEKVDFRLPDHPSWWVSKQGNVLYSDDIVTLPLSAVVLAGNENKLLEDFKRVGTLYGFTPSWYWQEAIDAGTIAFEQDNSLSVLIRLLYAKELDGLDLDLMAVRHQARELGYDTQSLVYSKTTPSQASIGYRLSTVRHPQELAAFNLYLQQNRQKIAALLQAYALADADRTKLIMAPQKRH